MEKATAHKIHWFWPWQDDAEEAWLAKMSAEGLHFQSLIPPGLYAFQKGKPRNVSYRLDFLDPSAKDAEADRKSFRSAGWEHVGKFSSWDYFRREGLRGGRTEKLIDPESKIRKHRKVIQSDLIILGLLMIVSVAGLASDPAMNSLRPAIIDLLAVILVFYSIECAGLMWRIQRLKKTARE